MTGLLLPWAQAAVAALQAAPRLASLAQHPMAAAAAPAAPAITAPPVVGATPDSSGLTAPASPAPAADDFPQVLLTVILACTALMALVVMFLPDRTPDQRGRVRIATLFGSGAAFLVGLATLNVQLSLQSAGGVPKTLEENRGWLSLAPVTSGYHLVADGLTLAMLLLSTVVFVAASVGSWRVHERIRLWCVLLLVLETGVNGALFAWDHLLLLVFLGAVVVPVGLMAALWGGVRSPRVGARAGAVLLGALLLLTLSAAILAFKSNQGSFDFDQYSGVFLQSGVGNLGYWLDLVALAALFGAVPVHRWLVHLLADGPPVLAAVVGGVVVNLAGYLLLRVVLVTYPGPAHHFSLVLVLLGAVTTCWAAAAAVAQRDLRRLIAYSCVSRNGVVLLGIGAGSTITVTGAVLAMLANGIATALLVGLGGVVVDRLRTRELDRMGGLAARMPKVASLWAVALFSVAGIPFLAGFAADFAILGGAFPLHRVATGLVALGLLMGSGALLWGMHRVLGGPEREADARVRDAGTSELFQLVPLAVMLVLLGIAPGRLAPIIDNGVRDIVSRLLAG